MIELYVYSTIMSPGNQGVFQLLKEVIFEELWYFETRENGAILEWFTYGQLCFWLAGKTNLPIRKNALE
jgi:hypothetical protein